MTEQSSIFSKSSNELGNWLSAKAVPSFRSAQLLDWLFVKRCFDPNLMLNLPKALREDLKEQFVWDLPEIIERVDSPDGASKLLLKTGNNHVIETVILRYENRTSLCLSSQVGCKLSCSFCQTGKLGFFRHLSTAEIIGQFCLAQSIVAKEENRQITHTVFMGMGEPLDNFDAVVKAVNILIEDFKLSARKVTISTAGIAPKIAELAKLSKASLAISLHAGRDELRSQLMPINRKYPLAQLKDALLSYQMQTGAKITFEYILIKDLNCGRREAKELVKFLHGLRAKINLIPFNSHPGLEFERPEEEDIRAFQWYLTERSFAAPVRYSLGLEASAACGQLAAKNRISLEAIPARQSVLAYK